MSAPLQWHTQITVAAPRERVWEIADDITLIPRYHPDVRHVELISGSSRRAPGVRYRCTVPSGRKGNCIEEITDYVPGSRFTTAFPEDSWGLSERLAEFTVETVVEAVAEGTRIRLNAYYRPRTLMMKLLNPLGLRRLMARRAARVLVGVKRLAEESADQRAATSNSRDPRP
jgi:uncharacterized protein YndB with AHSA1/START domain